MQNRSSDAQSLSQTFAAEEAIWQSNSITFFGATIPWVSYELTRYAITINSGLISNTREYFLLVRIMDIAIDRNLFDRIHKTGTIRFTVNWKSERSIRLRHVRNADKTYDLICQMIKEAKQRSHNTQRNHKGYNKHN